MPAVTRFLVLVLGLSVVASAPGCRKDELVELTVFHTNDVHMHYHPPKSDPFGLGGIARLSTLLKQRRALAPVSIALDGGDWSESTWFYNIDTGASALRFFDVMKFDAAVVGNHDYLNGPDRTYETVKDAELSSLSVVGANFDFGAYDKPDEFKRHVKPWVILERGGLKIGVIGLSTVDYVFSFWLKPLVVTEPIAAAQELARELRPQVDVLIVLSHNIFETNMQIARSVLGVDAVVSGHSHRKIGKAVLVKNAGRDIPVVETGEWGTFLGELKLKVNKNKKHVAFAGYRLLPVLAALDEDPVVREMVAAEDEKLDRLYGGNTQEVVAETEVDLTHDDSHVANLGDIASKAYRDMVGTEAALELLALTRVKLVQGTLTVRDMHDVMPHILDFKTGKEWTIKVWNARGSDISLFLNLIYLTNVIPLDRTGFFAHDNIEVNWEPRHEGNSVARLTQVKVNGQILDPNRRYQVALCDGLLMAIRIASEKLHLGIDFSQLHETGIEGWRAILAYGQKTKRFTAEGLRKGSRSYTTIADPAVFHYAISYDGSGLQVQVANDGLAPAIGARLRCLSGLANDLVTYETDEQVYTPIGEVEVPVLQPGQGTVARIAWDPVVSGFWPVKCEVVASQDGYPGNSTAERVLRIIR